MPSSQEKRYGYLHQNPLQIINWPSPTPDPGGLSISCLEPSARSSRKAVPPIQPKTITVSLNQLKRCHGKEHTPQQVDFDIHQLEGADDDAEGPMKKPWITTEGAAATCALNQDIGDVHAPSLREKRAPSTATEPPPTRRSAVHHQDFEDVAPSIVVHHEHTNVLSQPDLSGSTHRSPPQTDSATMTAQDVSATSSPSSNAAKLWEAPRSQTSFDQSAQVRHCSSQAWEEGTLPPVPEVSQDDVFTPSPPALRDTSTTATAPSTTDMAPSEPDHGDTQGQKRAPPLSDTSYSRVHQTSTAGPSNCLKRPTRPCLPSSSDEDDTPCPRPR